MHAFALSEGSHGHLLPDVASTSVGGCVEASAGLVLEVAARLASERAVDAASAVRFEASRARAGRRRGRVGADGRHEARSDVSGAMSARATEGGTETPSRSA